VILPGSAEDRQGLLWSCRDQVVISRDHTRISSGSRSSFRHQPKIDENCSDLAGSGRDQLGSRRDKLRIEVILPGSAEDRQGLLWSCRDQVVISRDHARISSGSR